MKILIVNFSDSSGGAARAASRLHQSLLNLHVDSTMFVLMKNTDSYLVHAPKTNIEKVFAKLKALINPLPLKKYKASAPFSPSFSSSFNLVKKINHLKPDIVHLHWINAGMLKVEDLNKIEAPIVWSLHDMWPFTGGCHYSNSCKAYEDSCGKCPVLNSNKNNDISKKLFRRKQKAFKSLENMTIVGLSKWLVQCSKSSSLFEEKRIVNLPNPIDTAVFKPFDKMKARELWNLPLDKKLVLFGAMSGTSDERKGFEELTSALAAINSKNIELLIFGSTRPETPFEFGFKTHYLGELHDDTSLVTLYSAADVTVTPSKQENLSNVIMESLSCGTPVVGFNIGGNKDLIDHKKNGYLAEPFKEEDLSKGIEWVLDDSIYNDLSESSRVKVVKDFNYKKVGQDYINLYKNILKQE